MKALSMTQPWASLVAIGAKKIETRSWGTTHRGPLAIHAAKAMPEVAERLALSLRFREVLAPVTTLIVTQTLPRGLVIATGELADCVKLRGRAHAAELLSEFGAEHEQTFGDYTPGRWAWVLFDIVPLAEPVPARGYPSLWDWEPIQ